VLDEGYKMFSRKQLISLASRNVMIMAGAALILTLGEPAVATAGAASPVVKQVSVAGDLTDLSARRRVRRHYRGNPAAGLAIMGAMIGTFGAIAAQRDYYYDGPGYYYGPPPVYYGPRRYYRPYPYYGPHVYYYPY
jgi:hypothetical protein